MTNALPNPFDFSSVCPPQADKPAGAPPAPETAPAGTRFVLDEERFMLDIEPLPIFLSPLR